MKFGPLPSKSLFFRLCSSSYTAQSRVLLTNFNFFRTIGYGSSSGWSYSALRRFQYDDESRSVNGSKVAQLITGAVRSSGIQGPNTITGSGFGDVLQLTEWNLSATGISQGGKNSVLTLEVEGEKPSEKATAEERRKEYILDLQDETDKLRDIEFVRERQAAIYTEEANPKPKALDTTQIEGEDYSRKDETFTVEVETKATEERNRELTSSTKLETLKQRQWENETQRWEWTVQFYNQVLEDSSQQKLVLPHVKSLSLDWFKPLREAIQASIDSLKTCKLRRPNYAPYMKQLSPDLMAAITMHKIMQLFIDDSMRVGFVLTFTAALHIGKAIDQEVKFRRLMQSSQQKEILNEGDKSDEVAHIKIGAHMIDLLITSIHIKPPMDQLGNTPPAEPAFVRSLKRKFGKTYGCLECHPMVQKDLEKIGEHIVFTYTPMLIPPQKWTRHDRGPYLFLTSDIVRTHGSKQRKALKETPNRQLKPYFEGLDALAHTKWRINRTVLSVADRFLATEGKLPGVGRCHDIPLLEECDIIDQEDELRRDPKILDIKLKLAVAHKLKDEEGFYFPHNLDFRGRAYPIPTQLNHYGFDLYRGLLEFSDGKPLGKSGLRWLKIHLANLYGHGVDKLPYHGRVEFTDSHLEKIVDSADNPVEGQRWWLRAEDPYQCLAVCFNLAEALRNPFPETTISHVHVHQDGTCNGLQHYTALGRDMLGATAVNMVKNENPADVYSRIAIKVREIMRGDAAEDPSKNPDAILAKYLINKVDRKLVKQTVMTSVYGVTSHGATRQILKRMEEHDASGNDFDMFKASSYVSRTIFTAIGETLESAKSVMRWLGDCAKVIAKKNEPVSWTTPLGLPVIQPYYKLGEFRVLTNLQTFCLARESDQVNVRKQVAAFPPNFIHCLDASHMLMTAVACYKAGMSFAAVHDSYWSHACDVDQMKMILKEKFADLYEVPILEQLLENFQKSFPDERFPALPRRGEYDVREVLRTDYFFN